MGEISVKTGNNARNGGKNSLNRLIRCVCGKKIGPDPRNFNQRVSLGRNDLLIRTFLSSAMTVLKKKEPYQYELLEMYYVYGVTLRALGVKLGISLNQVVIRLQKAEGFIDGCLAMLGVSLEIDCYI